LEFSRQASRIRQLDKQSRKKKRMQKMRKKFRKIDAKYSGGSGWIVQGGLPSLEKRS